MASWNSHKATDKSIGQVLHEIKQEAREFIATRIAVASSEMSEKAAICKSIAPIGLIGAAVILIAVLFLSAALVATLVWLIGPVGYAWAAAFAMVGVLYGIIGGACLFHVTSVLRSHKLGLERTLRVLKQDQIWMQLEVRTDDDKPQIN